MSHYCDLHPNNYKLTRYYEMKHGGWMKTDIVWVIVVVLLILWLFGMLGYFPFFRGNLIHVLLVIALVVILYRLSKGKKLF